MTIEQARAHARAIFAAGVAAVEPGAAVRRHLRRDGESLVAGESRIALTGRVVVVGMGKASAAMASAVEQLLGERITAGVVVTKYGHGVPLAHLQLCEAGHPVPDAASERAGSLIERSVQGLTARDLVIVCLSGGASALVVAPREGISLADKQEVARLLLASGADITAMNTVRKKLSRLKGGGLVRAAAPARVLCLAISDVSGDDWASIGSGPTTPDPSSTAQAWEVITRLGLGERLPAAVRALFERARLGQDLETLKPGDPAWSRVTNLLLASNRQALEAAAAHASSLGYAVVLERALMQGPAHVRGAEFARELMRLGEDRARARCLLVGGETTVVLGEGHGRGGRNQEFALAAALELELERAPSALRSTLAVLGAGTDGTDGPTDAAGGLVDGGTVERARAHGHDALAHLRTHDAYPLLASSQDLLMTGPTGTNVMDLAIGIALPA